MDNQSLPHTAVPSWSGFIYQGRVSLYYILTILNCKSIEEINTLSIQIDSIEDFTILKSTTGDLGIPVSMHQVKAVNEHLYSAYKKDMHQMEEKWNAIANPDVQAFFHFAIQNEKTKAQIEALHPNLKVYCYENDAESCSLDQIDIKIREQISRFLLKYNLAGSDNANTLQLFDEILEKIISDKVIYLHSLNHGGIPIKEASYKNPIPLKEFLDVLVSDISKLIQDEQYFEGKIKSNLNRYHHEFCFNAVGMPYVVLEKMDKYLIYFNSLKANNFKTFLQKIRPYKKICFSTLVEYTDGSIIQEEIQESFLFILSEIKESNNGKKIGWIDATNKSYHPTAIKESNSDSAKIRISRKILDASLTADVDMPFDSDFLITDECNVDSIIAKANNITVIEQLNSNIIVNWKNVALIDLETAKNKLNG